MFGRVASLLVADEALSVPHVLRPFTRREIDFIHIHGIGVPGWSGGLRCLGQWDITVSPTPEFPESYHISVELSCLVEPLFPFPTGLCLSLREGGGGHHDSKLVGHSLLEGVHKDAVKVDSTVCSSQLEGGGILVEIPIKHVHVEGVDSLVGSVFGILWDEGIFKGGA